MATDLPENIELMPGRLSINGRGSEEIIEASTYWPGSSERSGNDTGTSRSATRAPSSADSELRKLFADLETRKARNTKTEVSPG